MTFCTGDAKGLSSKPKACFADDPKENWVNTHNTRGAKYLTFWRWWTNRDSVSREEWQTPPQLKGYRPAKHSPTNKKRRTREQLWTPEEHAVFLKHCEDLRLACYHAMALETGARPGELLDVKLGNIKVEIVPSTGKRVCEFRIGGGVGGKMKTVIKICRLFPKYIKCCLNDHRFANSKYPIKFLLRKQIFEY